MNKQGFIALAIVAIICIGALTILTDTSTNYPPEENTGGNAKAMTAATNTRVSEPTKTTAKEPTKVESIKTVPRIPVQQNEAETNDNQEEQVDPRDAGINPEEYFSYSQSTQQAFYFIESATIDGVELAQGDWIATFKDNTCVGSTQWTEPYNTVVPGMGNDNGPNYPADENTINYLEYGEIPTFVIYDVSEDILYQATASMSQYSIDPNLEFSNNALPIINLAVVTNNMPPSFAFQQSTLQAFYFVSTIEGLEIDENDWIGAFNGDVCIGSVQWNGPLTDVPVMGDELSEWTVGYMTPGEIPTFVIYDSSENMFYETTASLSEDYPSAPNLGWHNMMFYFMDLTI